MPWSHVVLRSEAREEVGVGPLLWSTGGGKWLLGAAGTLLTSKLRLDILHRSTDDRRS